MPRGLRLPVCHAGAHDEGVRPLAEGCGGELQPGSAAATFAVLEIAEKDHGRSEPRRYYQSAALDWFADRAKLTGVQSVGMVEAIGGRRTVERRYYLTSLSLRVEPFARWCGTLGRNKLHWVRDVCFREDQSRTHTGYAVDNLVTLRRLALNVLPREKTKTRHQGQTTQRQLGPCLPALIAD